MTVPLTIPLFKPSYNKLEEEAVARVLKSRWTGLGPETEIFEHEFADHIGARRAVATNSCTSALMLALKCLDIEPGDEVIVPALTFVSTAHAVVACGGTPVICDVDEDTWMIDWEDARSRMTDRTLAVIAVNYAGAPVAPKKTLGDVPVIWDLAHAAGTRQAFDWPILACWSFHSVKNLSCGDGGMLTTNSTAMADRAKQLRWMGIDKSTWIRAAGEKQYSWQYECNEVGIKAHMNDITAAIGRVQLSKLHNMQLKRERLAKLYQEDLIWYPSHFGMQAFDETLGKHGWHLFALSIQHQQAEPYRDALIEVLKDHGISSGVHYRPLHHFGCYRSETELPVVDKLWKQLITLPLYVDMTPEDVAEITSVINGFFHS